MIYLFLPVISLSCDNLCCPCLASSVKFLKNKCTNEINSTFGGGDLACSNCIDSYGSLIPCFPLNFDLPTCQLNENCGPVYFSSLYGTVHIPNLNKSSICMWKFDLRGSIAATQVVQISYGGGDIGTLLLIGYLLPARETPSPAYISNQLYIDSEAYNASSAIQFLSTNYIVAVFYTGNLELIYADLTIGWNLNQESYSNLSTILTAVALSLASVFCLACSCVLIKKLYINRYEIQTINYRSQSNNQETTLFNENEMQRMFPIETLKEDLSQTNCAICFEGLPTGSNVRKLPCRHIFHSRCIEEWFLANAARPKCPLCKYSPFENEPIEFPGNQDIEVIDVN